jgi:hypothetical protein
LLKKYCAAMATPLPVPETVELVQVEFQNVFLGKMLLHAERVQEFLELFLDAAFFAAENVLDRLLRE